MTNPFVVVHKHSNGNSCYSLHRAFYDKDAENDSHVTVLDCIDQDALIEAESLSTLRDVLVDALDATKNEVIDLASAQCFMREIDYE